MDMDGKIKKFEDGTKRTRREWEDLVSNIDPEIMQSVGYLNTMIKSGKWEPVVNEVRLQEVLKHFYTIKRLVLENNAEAKVTFYIEEGLGRGIIEIESVVWGIHEPEMQEFVEAFSKAACFDIVSLTNGQFRISIAYNDVNFLKDNYPKPKPVK